MARFRKKPVEIEAIQWTGDNLPVLSPFIGGEWHMEAAASDGQPLLVIHTLEGQMVASLGDWIIKGVKGEFYPCKPEIFAATYEVVE